MKKLILRFLAMFVGSASVFLVGLSYSQDRLGVFGNWQTFLLMGVVFITYSIKPGWFSK